MRKVYELRNVIANQFACEYKAYDLREVCNANRIEPDVGLKQMNNKIICGNCVNIYFRVKYTTRASTKITKWRCGSSTRRMVIRFAVTGTLQTKPSSSCLLWVGM